MRSKTYLVLLLLVCLLSPFAGTRAAPTAFKAPDATVGVPYQPFRIPINGAQGAIKCRLVDGQPPPGIVLDPSGMLSGMPERKAVREEPYRFTVEVTDSWVRPRSITLDVSLLVNPAPLTVGSASDDSQGDEESNGRNGASFIADEQPRALTAPASSAATIFIAQPVSEGAKQISGFAPPGVHKLMLEVFSDNGALVQKKSITMVDDETGEFAIAVAPLEAKHRVRIMLPRDRSLVSESVVEAHKPPAPPVIKGPLQEGQKQISGFASGKVKKVRASVFDLSQSSSEPVEAPSEVDRRETEEISKNGAYTISLDEPLKPGQRVTLQAFDEVGSSAPSAAAEVIPTGDWGRAHSYIAFGMVFSSERDDFSVRDPYLNVLLDYNWYSRRKGKFKYFANTFLDTRLTSLPVSVKPPQEDPANQSMGDGTSEGNKDETKETPEDVFLASRKAAQLQLGFYVPMYREGWMTWRQGRDRNAFAIGPLLKGGIETLTERSNDASGPINKKDLFTSWSVGFRAGMFKLPHSEHQAPETISYLDITWGKWRAIERIVGETETESGIATLRVTPIRMGIEGRVKLPKLPFRIGVNANQGRRGPDDLRFTVDTSFEFGNFLKKLF